MTEEQKLKNRKRAKDYYWANREKVLEYQKQYNIKNVDKKQEYYKRDYVKEKARVSGNNYYKLNKEKVLEKAGIYRQNNKKNYCRKR